ncbi:anti-sigma factor [Planctomicrobium piriforme]|nr:hypothetical protein [Planctomicrobium piriforme]
MNSSDLNLNDAELFAYLDEMLSVERTSSIEQLLRSHPELRVRLAELMQRRDQGGHTIGEIWRRHRLSCPARSQLGSFLLGVASPEQADYIQFHLEEVGCRVCQANLADLQASQSSDGTQQQQRQRRYFESSAGLLRPGQND